MFFYNYERIKKMASVTIYSTGSCPFCVRAKMLLDNKGVEYNEIDVSAPEERMKMVEKANGLRTVPQIFINEQHIGGFDDLHKLDVDGKLDEML